MRTVFTRLRNGVKYPAQLAGDNIKSPDVAGRGAFKLVDPRPDDEQILVNAARRCRNNGFICKALWQALVQIDLPTVAK